MSGARYTTNALYKFKKLDFLNTEGAILPEAYKKFYREWKMTEPAPVHYIPPPAEWVRNEDTGEVKRVPNVPIRLKHVPESHLGIWGGEAVIQGFQKRSMKKTRVPHFWVPNLRKSAVYSEILNKTMTMTVTERTIDLIFENYGFDNYILKTKACDLQSGLAVSLKRKMLEALYYKTLYPDDPVKQENIYDKYKHFLEEYSEEEIKWYGFSAVEAIAKYHQLEFEQNRPVPLKHQLRLQFIDKLVNPSGEKEKESEPAETTKSTWISQLNPFSTKK